MIGEVGVCYSVAGPRIHARRVTPPGPGLVRATRQKSGKVQPWLIPNRAIASGPIAPPLSRRPAWTGGVTGERAGVTAHGDGGTATPNGRRDPDRKQRDGTTADRRAIAALLLGVVAAFADIYTTQPILPTLGRVFAVTPARSGLTVSAAVFCVGLAATFYGPLSDRIGHKPVMVWSCALLVVPTLGAALAPTFELLLLCRLLQGLLIPGTTVVAVALVQEEFPPAWRGAATGAWVSATTIGGLASRLVAGLAAELGGWRWAFLLSAGTTALGALLMARWLPGGLWPAARDRGAATRPLAQLLAALGALGRAYAVMFRFFRRRRIVGVAAVGFGVFFAFIAVFTYLPYRVAAPPFSFGPAATGSLFLTYLAGTVVTPWVGRLSDARGRRATIAGAMAVVAAGMALTAAPALVALILGLVLFSGGMFAVQAVATAFVGEQAPEAKGGATAFYLLFYYLGATCSPPVAGLAWQAQGWGGVLALCLALLLAALAALVFLCR